MRRDGSIGAPKSRCQIQLPRKQRLALANKSDTATAEADPLVIRNTEDDHRSLVSLFLNTDAAAGHDEMSGRSASWKIQLSMN
jgi:hypothetical protein